MTAAETGVLTLYYLVLSVLAVYSIHRLYLVRLRRRTPPPERVTGDVHPPLTIQLPLYNEPNVAARLLHAVSRIEYGGALDIQVLDDSTDDTRANRGRGGRGDRGARRLDRTRPPLLARRLQGRRTRAWDGR